MGKIILGLLLGLLIGIGCRYFDIPLPSPPRLVGALVVLSMTFGYIATDFLIIHQANKTGTVARLATTAQYCGGPTGLPPSHKQRTALSEHVPSSNAAPGAGGKERIQ